MSKRKPQKTTIFDSMAYQNKAWADLIAATDADKILDALARGLWAKHAGAECPPDRIPTERALRDRLREIPFSEWAGTGWGLLSLPDGPRLAVFLNVPGEAHPRLFLPPDAHAEWLKAPKEDRGPHPAAALVRAWQALPKPAIEAKEYTSAILPRYAGDTLEVEYTDEALGEGLAKRARAPERIDGWAEGAFQRDLFPPPEKRLPLRVMVDDLQGIPKTDHQGAVSHEARLFDETYIAATGIDFPEGGLLIAFDFDHIRRALYPNWDGGRFHSDFKDRIRRALRSLSLDAYIEVSGLGPVIPVQCRTPIHHIRRGKDKVVMHALAPSSLRRHRGGLVQVGVLRRLGFGKANQHALYKALVQYWDRHGTENGRIIWPTRPAVHRDEAGRILGADGKPVMKPDGTEETRWRKGQRTGEYEPNPKAAAYPPVSRQEIMRFLGAFQWSDAKRILDAMQAEDVFTYQETAEGVIFLPSIRHCLEYGRLRDSSQGVSR